MIILRPRSISVICLVVLMQYRSISKAIHGRDRTDITANRLNGLVRDRNKCGRAVKYKQINKHYKQNELTI